MQPPKYCACLDLQSLEGIHAEYGFTPELFDKVILSDIEIDPNSKDGLDDYLANPALAWEEGKGLYIWGENVGCGKTSLAHLAVRRIYEWGLANKCVDAKYRAWYVLASTFASYASKFSAREAFKVKMDFGAGDEEVDLWTVNGPVVLDEFGRESTGIGGMAAKGLYESFFRERTGKPTIIVTHLDPLQAWNILTEQTISILSASMTVVHLPGLDKRAARTGPFYGR